MASYSLKIHIFDIFEGRSAEISHQTNNFLSSCFGLEFFVFGYFLGRIVINYERNRKLSVQELEFAKEQATRIQELDHLKTRFFTNISHEFRTPLTLLTGPLEELQQKYPKEVLLSMMRRNVSRLQVLINQLLDLSKLEAGEMKVEMQQGNLAQFFLYIFSSFESLAQNQQIHFHITQNQPSFEAYFDADKIEKIITNLLSNAFKFTPKNGRITVTVEYSPSAPNGGVAFFSPIGGGGAVITVSDNGIELVSNNNDITVKNNAYAAYGKVEVYTGDATPNVIIKTITPADNSAGTFEVDMAGIASNMDAITGKKHVRYRKTGGNITLGSITNIVPTTADNSLATANWTITAASGKLEIKVTGVANATIKWKPVFKLNEVY